MVCKKETIMKITIEHYGTTWSCETSDDIGLFDSIRDPSYHNGIITIFEKFLKVLGFVFDGELDIVNNETSET
jgi:hypothetical protein